MINQLDIKILDNYLNNSKEFLAREQGKRDKLKEQLESLKEKSQDLEKQLDLLTKVSFLFQRTSLFAREQAKKQVESLVTKCLQYIFETNIKFEIEIEELRGKSNAEFFVINEIDDLIIKTKPELSRGGGVIDIVSLAIRIAFLQTHKPKIQGPLILDEPAKHVSEEYIFNVADFLKQTSEMFNRQIIIVTHNHHLASMSNNAYRVELKGTQSSVNKISS